MNRTYSWYLLSLSCLLLLPACRSHSSEDPLFKESQTVFEESMALHDAVMPNMNQAQKRIEELQQAINRMNVRAMPIDEAQMEALVSTQKNLQAAYDGMKDWMMNLTPLPAKPLAAAPMAKVLQEQQAQRDRIIAIRDQMDAGLGKATQLLGQ